MATMHNEASFCTTLLAAADLSTKQYFFMEISAAQTVNTTNAITDNALGVLQNKPAAASRDAVVCYMGTTKVVAGAAISAGALVAPTAAGKAQTAVSTQKPRGIALEAATADNDIIEILLLPTGVPLV